MGKVYTVRISEPHMTQIIRKLAEMAYRDAAPIIGELSRQINAQNAAASALTDEEARAEILDAEAAEESAN
ncbi:MAG: hypothetical protein AB1781_11220 [Pseudomonadota bacterium]